jgi:hypothetical protein
MPTPSEDITLPSPPPEASSSRASFASCPPEEDREHHAPREERIDTPQAEGDATGEDEHMTIQRPTPDETAQVGASHLASSEAAHEKGEHIEDAGIDIDPPSAVGSPDVPSDNDARVEQSGPSIGADVTNKSLDSLYLTFPRDPNQARVFLLHSGALTSS